MALLIVVNAVPAVTYAILVVARVFRRLSAVVVGAVTALLLVVPWLPPDIDDDPSSTAALIYVVMPFWAMVWLGVAALTLWVMRRHPGRPF